MEAKKQLEKLYKQHADSVYRYLKFKLDNDQLAEDLASTAFLKLYEQLASEKNIENPRAWLMTVARNKLYDHWKKSKADTNYNYFSEDSSEFDSETSSSQIGADIEAIRIETELITEEEIETSLACLEKLDQKSQDVIILKIWDDYKFKEIADILNEKLSTVKLRYYRGLERLKQLVNLELEDTEAKKRYGVLPIPLIYASLERAGQLPQFTGASTGTGITNLFNNLNFSEATMQTQSSLFNSISLKTIGVATAATITTAGLVGGGIFLGSEILNQENQSEDTQQEQQISENNSEGDSGSSDEGNMNQNQQNQMNESDSSEEEQTNETEQSDSESDQEETTQYSQFSDTISGYVSNQTYTFSGRYPEQANYSIEEVGGNEKIIIEGDDYEFNVNLFYETENRSYDRLQRVNDEFSRHFVTRPIEQYLYVSNNKIKYDEKCALPVNDIKIDPPCGPFAYYDLVGEKELGIIEFTCKVENQEALTVCDEIMDSIRFKLPN